MTPPRDELLSMYRQMVLIRRFEERVLAMCVAGTIEGVVHPYIGQEAVAVGVCSLLATDDAITSTHRGHGHCIAKGADTKRMMAELLGRQDGYCAGKGGSMHIADFDIGMLGANGIVAAGLPIATGAALAATLAGNTTVTVAMFGEGAAGAGPFHETINVASLWKLPLILVCENNGVAQLTPPERGLSSESIAALAAPYGVPSEIVDGNDVLAVREAVSRAIERARAGDGPTLIEARTYRMRGHAYRGADVPELRDLSVIDRWRERDPIEAFEQKLLADGALTAGDPEAVREAVDEELDEALRFAEASPYPELESALEGMFAS